MTETIYNYPKSFCDCYNCDENTCKNIKKGIPTNMSVYDCNFDNYFKCTDEKLLQSELQPTNKEGHIHLNPQVYTEKTAKNFSNINLGKHKDSRQNECLNSFWPMPNGWLQLGPVKEQVIKNDPRLYSAGHQRWITLDQPPMDSSMKLSDIPYDKNLDKYGQYYNTYSDINAGQITYYVNRALEQPFHNPNYVNTGFVERSIYQDPMGGIQPEYSFTNVINDNPITSSERDNYRGNLSWIEDSTNHREDIMTLQQSKVNGENWQYRYSPIKNK